MLKKNLLIGLICLAIQVPAWAENPPSPAPKSSAKWWKATKCVVALIGIAGVGFYVLEPRVKEHRFQDAETKLRNDARPFLPQPVLTFTSEDSMRRAFIEIAPAVRQDIRNFRRHESAAMSDIWFLLHEADRDGEITVLLTSPELKDQAEQLGFSPELLQRDKDFGEIYTRELGKQKALLFTLMDRLLAEALFIEWKLYQTRVPPELLEKETFQGFIDTRFELLKGRDTTED